MQLITCAKRNIGKKNQIIIRYLQGMGRNWVERTEGMVGRVEGGNISLNVLFCINLFGITLMFHIHCKERKEEKKRGKGERDNKHNSEG